MANYHLEVGIISRGKGQSFTRSVSYICGKKIRDLYDARTYYHIRNDVSTQKIFLPVRAPLRFHQLQELCDAVNTAERRYDARTARTFIGSLPNEVSLTEQERIVEKFVEANFLLRDLCAIVAIHEGKNEIDTNRNNPHAHIIVPTRTIDENGFCEKKDRELDKRNYIYVWREDWANTQNRAYERANLDIRVSHESLEVQGKDREPTIHLSRFDWQREQRGERTAAGDKKRAIEERNQEHDRQLLRDMQRSRDRGLVRDR